MGRNILGFRVGLSNVGSLQTRYRGRLPQQKNVSPCGTLFAAYVTCLSAVDFEEERLCHRQHNAYVACAKQQQIAKSKQGSVNYHLARVASKLI